MVNEASACHPPQRPMGTPPASQEEEGRGKETSELGRQGKRLQSPVLAGNPWAGQPCPRPPEATLPAAHPASDPPAPTHPLPGPLKAKSPHRQQPPRPSGVVGMILLGTQHVLIKTPTDPGFRVLLPEDRGRACVCNGPSQKPGKHGPSTEGTALGPRSGRGLVLDNQAGRSLISVHK